MVDWMLTVVKSMGCQSSSFFKAVQIYDMYYAKVGATQTEESVLLIGIVSLFIATKYEDVSPLLLKTVVQKLGQN